MNRPDRRNASRRLAGGHQVSQRDPGQATDVDEVSITLLNTPANLGGLRHRRKSRSPNPSSRSHAATRQVGNGSKADPYTIASSTGLVRTSAKPNSSASASTSTAITAASGSEDMLLDHGGRGQARPPAASTSQLSYSFHSGSAIPAPPAQDAPSSSHHRSKHEKGKGIDRPQSRHRHRNKDQDPAEAQTFSGPLAIAEFERMKKEIEALKKTVHDSKKNAKKQTKRIEELKTELVAMSTTNVDKDTQLQVLKTKYQKKEELIATIETSLQCQICMELLCKPFALAPCGHILCLACLQEWFRRAPPSTHDIDTMDIDPDDPGSDPHYIINRSKSCPCCRAIVTRRPVPVFMVKSIVLALSKAKSGVPGIPGRDNALDGDDDPWKGIFPSSGDEDEDEDDDDEEDEDHEGFSYEDAVGWGYHESVFGYESDTNSGSDGEEDGEDGDGDESDEEASDRGPYVAARWEPPNITVDALDYDIPEGGTEAQFLSMLRRGCTPSMIAHYDMEYTHEQGLVAFVHSFVGDEDEDDDRTGERMHRIFLGWNIELAEEDEDGVLYMHWILDDLDERPERWEIQRRPGVAGAFDATKLVRAFGVEEYPTTDSDSEVWLDLDDDEDE